MMMVGFLKIAQFLNRPLTVDDAIACSLLHAAAFPIAWSCSEFENLISSPLVSGDGCFSPKTNELAGFSLSRLVAQEAELLTIVVVKSARGKRIGTEILSTHLQTLQQLGTKKVFLEVAEDNIGALRLYNKLRFKEVGQRPSYYPAANGTRKLALVLMREM